MNALVILSTAYMAFAATTLAAIPAAVVDEPDRRTEAEFAKENNTTLTAVQQRYAASATIKCGAERGTVNLVLRKNIAVTSAHMFVDRQTCARIVDPQRCTVQFENNNTKIERRILHLESAGFKCPALPRISDDWAILRIEDVPSTIKPFAIPDEGANNVVAGDQITLVGGLSADFMRRDRTGVVTRPKHLGKCLIKRVYRPLDQPILFASSCDSSRGASGAAILVDSGERPLLIGIHQGSQETLQQVQQAMRRGQPNAAPYKDNEWASYHVPIAGEFLRSLLRHGNGGLD